jgi:hypothetical protein
VIVQTVPDDAANGFGISASLDVAAAEGAEPCAAVASNTNTSLLLITHTLAIMTHASLYTAATGAVRR